MSAASPESAPAQVGQEALNSQLPVQARRQLEALRAAVDVRLSALEAALADPSRGQSLEQLILDLARVATEEAQVAASKACIDTKLAADTQVSVAVAAVQATLQQERDAAAVLRQRLAEAQEQINRLDNQREADLSAAREGREHFEMQLAKQREAVASTERALEDAQAKLADERRAAADLQRALLNAEDVAARIAVEKAHALSARDEISATLEQERASARELSRTLDTTRSALEAERAAIASLRQDLERARTHTDAVAGETAGAVARLEQALSEADSRLDNERALNADLQRQIAAMRSELEQARVSVGEQSRQLESTRSAHDAMRSALERERASIDDLSRTLAAAQEALASEKSANERLREELDMLRTQQAARESGATTDLEQALSEVSSQLEIERAANRELRAAADQVSRRLAIVGTEIASVLEKHDKLTEELAREKQLGSELRQAHSDLQARFEAEQRTAAELKEAVARETEKRQREASDEERESRALRAELDEARSRIAALESEKAERDKEKLTSARRWKEVETHVRALTRERDELAEQRRTLLAEKDGLSAELGALTHLIGDRGDDAAAEPHEKRGAKTSHHRTKRSEDRLGNLPPPPRNVPETPAANVPVEPAVLPRDEEGWTAVRLADRVALAAPMDIQINGAGGLLHDISVAGCQLSTKGTLKPNQVLKISIPSHGGSLALTGKVMWARLETTGYRGGVQFKQPDETALDAFVRSLTVKA